jgi:hypothetical protein
MKDIYPTDKKATRPLRIVLIICIIIGLLSLKVASQQYYPAGLGKTNLKLWLTAADAGTLLKSNGNPANSNNKIATWTDKSGSGNDATQTSNSIAPIYQSNQLNGNGAVIFQDETKLLTGPSDAYQTMVAVRSLPGTGHYQTLFASPANTDFSIRGAGDGSAYTDGPNSNDWTVSTGATPTQWINGAQSLNGSTGNHILIAASNSPTNNSYSINSTFLSRGMNGNDPVYELLSYNSTLNTTQRRLLENYEGATWGLTSLLTAASAVYYTPPSLTTYNKDLVGIGYTSSTDNFLTNPVGATDGLGFKSNTGSTDFLNTAGYLMAAHNGQANTILTNVTISGVGPNVNRWNRSWYVQKSGGNASGNVTFQFSFNDYNSSAAPASSYVITLLYNATNGSFSSGTNKTITTTSSISGSTVSLSVNASDLSAGYYTIIWGPSSVLAIDLSSFDAETQGNTGLLNWQVAGSGGINDFGIERGTDKMSWTTIGRIPFNAPEDRYIFTDITPSPGINYYRIKMNGPDGLSNYSPIRTLSFDPGRNIIISTYPNPVTDEVQITTSNMTGPVTLHLYTMSGLMIKTGYSTSPAHMSLSMQDLPAGVYILEIATTANHYTQKIFKH